MTLKELRELKHDILVPFRKELCRVTIEDDDRFLLSNSDDYDGTSPYKMYGYTSGWWLCDNCSHDGQNIHRYLKPTKRRPI